MESNRDHSHRTLHSNLIKYTSFHKALDVFGGGGYLSAFVTLSYFGLLWRGCFDGLRDGRGGVDDEVDDDDDDDDDDDEDDDDGRQYN